MERKMRLIDPEVFEKEIQRYADAEETQSIINTGGRVMSWEHRQVLQTITAMEAAFKTIMDCMPTVDAVPAVRCRQCKFANPYERMDGVTGYYCLHTLNSFTYGQNFDRVFHPVKESEDFCSHGERRC